MERLTRAAKKNCLQLSRFISEEGREEQDARVHSDPMSQLKETNSFKMVLVQ